MKTAYDNIYYLCKKCDKVYDSYGREHKGDLDKNKLMIGHCDKCFKELKKKLEEKI